MPQVSRLDLPPLDSGGETLGERIARTRKERGYTQSELADKIEISQSIVSAIERDERKLSAEMAVRFALALDVSLDELLKPVNGKLKQGRKASRRVLRRLEQIEALPPTQQTALLRTIDAVLKANTLLSNRTATHYAEARRLLAGVDRAPLGCHAS